MKKALCFVFAVLIAVLFASSVFSENFTKSSAREKILSAIENAEKYQDYLVLSGANEYELAKNALFIVNARRCLDHNLKESCYNSIREEINNNDIYNGKKPVPTEE